MPNTDQRSRRPRRSAPKDPSRVSDATLSIVLSEHVTWEPLDEVQGDRHVTLGTDRPRTGFSPTCSCSWTSGSLEPPSPGDQDHRGGSSTTTCAMRRATPRPPAARSEPSPAGGERHSGARSVASPAACSRGSSCRPHFLPACDSLLIGCWRYEERARRVASEIIAGAAEQDALAGRLVPRAAHQYVHLFA